MSGAWQPSLALQIRADSRLAVLRCVALIAGGAGYANACAVAARVAVLGRAVLCRHAKGAERTVRTLAAAQTVRIGAFAFDAIAGIVTGAFEQAVRALAIATARAEGAEVIEAILIDRAQLPDLAAGTGAVASVTNRAAVRLAMRIELASSFVAAVAAPAVGVRSVRETARAAETVALLAAAVTQSAGAARPTCADRILRAAGVRTIVVVFGITGRTQRSVRANTAPEATAVAAVAAVALLVLAAGLA